MTSTIAPYGGILYNFRMPKINNNMNYLFSIVDNRCSQKVIIFILLIDFSPNPSHQKINYRLLPVVTDWNPARHLPPLRETVPTATGASMLCNENWMPTHRSLFPVVWRFGGREACAYEILAMLPYRLHAFTLNVGAVRFCKVKSATELRLRQPCECCIVVLWCSHATSPLIGRQKFEYFHE